MAGRGEGYGVIFSPYGSMVLKALIQALSSSGFLDLQHILLAALSHQRECGTSVDGVGTVLFGPSRPVFGWISLAFGY